MPAISRLAALWTNLTRRNRRERELDDEIRTTFELLVAEKIRGGLTEESARRTAAIELGGVEQVKELVRYAKAGAFLDSILQDVRYAVRSLRKNRGFAAIVVLTLALGIGANTAIFSAVNAVLLQPLPYKDSDRWVRIVGLPPSDRSGGSPPGRPQGLNHVERATLAAQSQTLSHIGVYGPKIVMLVVREQSIRLEGLGVSPEVFSMIGEQPVLGRTFETGDVTSESASVIVLSHGAWQRYFAGAPNVLGQRVTLDREPYSIIGVMGPDFQFPYPQAQFWVPFIAPTDDRARFQWSPPIARLKDGVTIEAAAAEVSRILQDLRGGIGGSTPAGPPGAVRQDPSPGSPFWTGPFGLVRFRDDLVAPVKPALVALAAAVGFVLLIACVNVANLLLARMTARRHEIAIRHALGAGRGRLIRQALIESVLLAIVGGIAGIGLASGGIALFRTIGMAPSRRDVGPFQLDIPRMDALGIDASVLEFTVVISLVTAGVFGLIPAIRQARSPRDGVHHSTGVSPIGGFDVLRQYRLQGLLIVAEVAMAMVLFVGGALLLFSVANLSKVNRGYDARNVLTFQVSVPWGRVFLGPSTPAERQRVTTFAEELVGRLAAVPGVTSAGYARQLPMFQLYMENVPLSRQPRPPDAPPPPPPTPGGPPADFPDARVVSRDFFTVMGTRLVVGRGFADRDGQGQPRVAIINETLARSGLLGANPIGQQVYFFGPAPWEIVGIVEDVRQVSLEQEPHPQVFFDFRQRPAAEGPYFAVRTSDGDHRAVTSSLLGIVRQIEPSATLDNVASMEELVTTSMYRRRLYAALSGLLAALAVGLAAVGIYGVMTYAVAQRTRELGIRMALGAQKSTVLYLVLGQSLALTGAGIILGLAGATAVTRYLEGMLFGLTPLDPSTFISVSMLFALVAGIAAYIPAHRATKVDPMVALRCE